MSSNMLIFHFQLRHFDHSSDYTFIDKLSAQNYKVINGNFKYVTIKRSFTMKNAYKLERKKRRKKGESFTWKTDDSFCQTNTLKITLD